MPGRAMNAAIARNRGIRLLTVKLRGRTTRPDKRRGRTLSFRARDAQPLTLHGPLQRLLGDPSRSSFIPPPSNAHKREREFEWNSYKSEDRCGAKPHVGI